MNHLEDKNASPETSPERQSTLDAHIRARLRNELEHLRKEEDDVRAQIENALEKENLDRERTMAGEASGEDGAGAGDVKSSAALLGDLKEVQAKVEKYHTRKDLQEYPAMRADAEAVVECYR